METNDLIKVVIRNCYDVHHELGCGFVEKVYENALVVALADMGLEARAQISYGRSVSREISRGVLCGRFS